jgi:hypothetical protein
MLFVESRSLTLFSELGAFGGPWGLGARIFLGGIGGSILGENAVDEVCDN